jgi:hypothetical protein
LIRSNIYHFFPLFALVFFVAALGAAFVTLAGFETAFFDGASLAYFFTFGV